MYDENTDVRDDVKAVHESIQALDQEGRNQLCALLKQGAKHDEKTADEVDAGDSEDDTAEHGQKPEAERGPVSPDKYLRGPGMGGLTIIIP